MWEFIKSLFRRPKIYDGSGNPVSNTRLDLLRGMHSGRNAEQMQFSLNLKKKRLNNPVYEYFEPGHEPGAAPKSEPVSADIASILFENGGMYYTGRVKTYQWKFNNKEYFHCVAEMVYYDRDQNVFVHGWQGPQPSTGYYYSDKWVWIEGPEPLIRGINYEKE